MSFLDRVKKELIKKTEAVGSDQEEIFANTQLQKELDEEIRTINVTIKNNKNEINDIKNKLKSLTLLYNIYNFMDLSQSFLEDVAESYYERFEKGKEISFSDPEQADKMSEWILYLEEIDMEPKLKNYSLEDISNLSSEFNEIGKRVKKLKEMYSSVGINKRFAKEVFDSIKDETSKKIEDDVNYIDFIETINEFLDELRELSGYIGELTKTEKDVITFLDIHKDIIDSKIKRSELENNFGTLHTIKSTIDDLTNRMEVLKEENKILNSRKSEAEKEKEKLKKAIKKKQSKHNSKGFSKLRIKEEIENANSIEELGFSSINDVKYKLGISPNLYIVVPIPNDAKSIKDIFNRRVEININVSYINTKTEYVSQVTYGAVNTDMLVTNENAVLIIPLNALNKNDITGIKNGKIELIMPNNLSEFKIIKPKERELDSGRCKVIDYTEGTINEQIKTYLGEDYSSDSMEYKYNLMLMNSALNGLKSEENRRKEAIARRLATDTYLEQEAGKQYEDEIYVDGRKYNPPSKSELSYYINEGRISFDKIEEILENLDECIKNIKKDPSFCIDKMCETMLIEFLNINKKARAEYYRELSTQIKINNKLISIKPPLPGDNSKIARKFTRKDEDIAYKTMKLALLCNRFAHLDNIKGETEERFFKFKNELINRTIELAKDNPNINVSRSLDEQVHLYTINLEIPGYSIISLHVANANNKLKQNIRGNKLEDGSIQGKGKLIDRRRRRSNTELQ